MLEKGYLHGDCLTCTGATVAENLADTPTVGELPRLLERKKRLELHTAVLGAVMKQVVAREVPRYCEAEDSRAAADQLAELLGPAGKGSANDKLRLYAYHALEGDADDARVAELRAALGEVLEAPSGNVAAGRRLSEARLKRSCPRSHHPCRPRLPRVVFAPG